MADRLKRSALVLTRRTASAVVIRGLDGSGLTLSGTGADVWDALAEPRSPAELVQLMRAAFDDRGMDLEADVRQLLSTLIDQGLIVRDDEP